MTTKKDTVRDPQEELLVEEMLGLLGEKIGIQYSEKVVSNGLHPEYFGIIDNPDAYAKMTGRCGDTDEMFLKIRDGVITEASFITDGCLCTIAACNAVSELAIGRLLDDCVKINEMTVLVHLDGLPEDHEHCAYLAAVTLQKAVRDYRAKTKKV